MKKALWICLLVLSVAAITYAGKPGGGGCSDVPISVTFTAPSTAPAAISNDDSTKPYINGVDGVTNDVIHYGSGCTGSHDATLLLQVNRKGTTRYFRLQLPPVIPGTIIDGGPATFADGSTSFLSLGFLNVRNLTGYTVIAPGFAATYYTRMTLQFAGPDGNQYRSVFYPDDAACPAGGTCVPDFTGTNDPSDRNLPEQTEWAQVTYMPRNYSQPWSSTNTDQWIVDGELATSTDPVIERSTLFLNGSSEVHYGQYSVPFKIVIVAQAPLPQ